MAQEIPDTEHPTRVLHMASGLGTSAARLAQQLRGAPEPPPPLPRGPFAGRLASNLADAMVETPPGSTARRSGPPSACRGRRCG